MLAYTARRLAAAAVTLVATTFLAFMAMRLASGDPIAAMRGGQAVDPAVVQAWRNRYGLDHPLLVQYFYFLRNALHGDLGMSYRFIGRPVSSLLDSAILVTLQWESIAFLAAIVLGLAVGTVCALKRRSWLDRMLRTTTVAFVGVPEFVLATVLVTLFASRLRLLPVSGLGSPSHYVLPCLTLAIYPFALLARVVRTSLLDTLGEDYVRTATAKGLSTRQVVVIHALPNALTPTITVIGILFGTILGGAFVIETIFDIPGMGRLAVDGITDRDYPVILGVTVVMTVMFLAVSLVVDLVSAAVDPRIRLIGR